MRKKFSVSFARFITTFNPTFVRNASTTSSFFFPQLNSYFEPNPRDTVYTYNRDIEISMKSGSIDHALQLFDEMPQRDVITWNTLISGHKRNGFPTKALHFYTQMVSQGFIETSSTFSTVLGIFSCEGLYQKGLQVHSRAIVLGLSLNIYVASALIDLYMNIGLVNFALKLFNDLPERNLATWNQLLRNFSEFETSQKLQLYSRLKKEGVVPNQVTFCYLIRGFSNDSLVTQGKKLHCYAIKVSWAESDIFVSNSLVDFYSACGNLTDAKRSFEVIPTDDIISWNSLVYIYAYNGLANNALEIFSTMQLNGKKPSIHSFVGLLNLCSGNVNIFLGKQVHCLVLKLGFDHNSSYIQSALIDMYGKCDKIENSVAIYENIPVRTLEVCNSLMTSFAWCGIVEDVIELFGLMVDEKLGFDEVSLSTTVNTLWKSAYGSLKNCKLLHNCGLKSGFDCDFAVSCSLIDSYSRFGDFKSSCKVFKLNSSPNVICFTSIVNSYSRNNMGTECIKLFEEMINEGLKPDKVTFLCVLTACKNSKMVKEGKIVFDSMKTVHSVDPESQHLACMVDLFGHAGLLEEAERLLIQSQVNDDIIWSSLLHHCRAHKNEKTGTRIAQILRKLEPENPAVWYNFQTSIQKLGSLKNLNKLEMLHLQERCKEKCLQFN